MMVRDDKNQPVQPPTHRFTRDELIFGLKDVLNKLRDTGQPATIRIIGGAAISMLYWSKRGATQDIDAEIGPADAVLSASAQTAAENGWPSDWLNNRATIFFPRGLGSRTAEWVTFYDRDGVIAQIATAETLLAMKLNSAITRGRREILDLALLLDLCGVKNTEDAEDHFRDYYSEELNDRAMKAVEAALATDTADMTPEDFNLEDD
jgi:hypothetical protein